MKINFGVPSREGTEYASYYEWGDFSRYLQLGALNSMINQNQNQTLWTPPEEFIENSENVIDTESNEDAIQVDGNRVVLNLDHPDLEDMNSAGGWRLITSASVLAVNVDGNTIRAFTSVCTHAQCDTNWDFRDEEFICGCHLSKFNTNGEVIKGPATADLQEFDVTLDQNIATILK